MPGATDGLIGWLARAAELTAESDRDLLARFAAGRDEAAFAALVRRHGPVVFAACRRTARHAHDAEDAFQATFLILARRADRIGRPELLGNYLYGVAVRVARKARVSDVRRRLRETAAAPEEAISEVERNPDLAAVIDEELAALPARQRDAVVLCDVQGKSRAEAAGALGVPEGTLSSRLNAARKKLADRLTRRGLGVPAAGLAAFISGETAAVPPRLASAAVESAVAGSAGGGVRVRRRCQKVCS